MNKILILNVFAKAKKEIEKKGVQNPSLTIIASEISDFIDQREDFNLGERRFRDYRNAALKLKDEENDITITQISVINGLCKYLGFTNYQEFTDSISTPKLENEVRINNLNNKNKIQNNLISSIKKNKSVIGFGMTAIVLSFLMKFSDTPDEKWMQWNNNQFEEVEFNSTAFNDGKLELWDQNRFTEFKKIEVDCNTVFFNFKGESECWYGKNNNADLEIFNNPGKHPQTGKFLKPITSYMIKKYICKEYKTVQ